MVFHQTRVFTPRAVSGSPVGAAGVGFLFQLRPLSKLWSACVSEQCFSLSCRKRLACSGVRVIVSSSRNVRVTPPWKALDRLSSSASCAIVCRSFTCSQTPARASVRGFASRQRFNLNHKSETYVLCKQAGPNSDVRASSRPSHCGKRLFLIPGKEHILPSPSKGYKPDVGFDQCTSGKDESPISAPLCLFGSSGLPVVLQDSEFSINPPLLLLTMWSCVRF